MPFSTFDYKKIYYYALCAMAFFVLMWGAIDLASSTIGFVGLKSSSPSVPYSNDTLQSASEKGDQALDSYYQRKMLSDRLWDSLARVVIAGGIFIYCRKAAEKTES